MDTIVQVKEVVLQTQVKTLEITSVTSPGLSILSTAAVEKSISQVVPPAPNLNTVLEIGVPGPPGPPGPGLEINAVGTYAEIGLYDNEPENFIFLASDLSEIFVRKSATPGIWSTGVTFGNEGVPGKSAYELAVLGGFVGTEEAWLESLTVVGADGKSAYQLAVLNGFVGTEAAWLASLVGTGTDGDSAYQIALNNGFIGSEAVWLASLSGTGESAYELAVSLGFVGTEAAWIASLSGVGSDGSSAYELAVANGFVGTEADWLASLVGVGNDGASAYEVAVANGFLGDETAWLASLVGVGNDGATAYEVAVTNGFTGNVNEWLASLVGEKGDNLAIDAFGTAAEKSNYNNEPFSFSFLDTENSLLYFRNSVTPGLWSPAISFATGPIGPPGPEGPSGVYTGPVIFVQSIEPTYAKDNDIWIEIA